MRVDLSRRADYAVRAMLALAAHERASTMSARLISERMDVPVRFLPHVLADLVRGGLVAGTPGRAGGYRLARPPGEISLLEILDAVEPDDAARCVLRGGPCGLDGHCAVHDTFAAASEALRRELRRARLADLSTNGGPSLPG